MRCGQWQRLMQVKLAGDDAPDQRQRLRDHIASCPGCKRRWLTMDMVAQSVRSAAPVAHITTRDLAHQALQQGRARGRPRRTGTVKWAVAAALILATGLIAIISRHGDPARLLAVADAAMAERPTHRVNSIYDATGTLQSREEWWNLPSGDRYGEVQSLVDGSRKVLLFRAAANIHWEHTLGTNEYALNWGAADVPRMEREFKEKAAKVDLPNIKSEEVRLLMGFWRALGADVSVTQRAGRLNGRDVVIIEARLTASAHSAPRTHAASDGSATFRFVLTSDESRVVRCTIVSYDGRGVAQLTEDTWPIEYDVQPPSAALRFEVPPDATVEFRGDHISPVWEHMPNAEKQAIQKTVDGLMVAYREGDFARFAQLCDFHAGFEYGVKSRFTPETMRQWWADAVSRERGRWQDERLTFDYAYETSTPPVMLLVEWSIDRTSPEAGNGWHLWRQRPLTVPAIVVLGRVRVTERSGQAQELGTYILLRKIRGEYRMILWSPPFG